MRVSCPFTRSPSVNGKNSSVATVAVSRLNTSHDSATDENITHAEHAEDKAKSAGKAARAAERRALDI